MFSNDTDETGLFSNDNNKITVNIKKKKVLLGTRHPEIITADILIAVPA